MEELDERAFLFVSHVSPHAELLGGITRSEIYQLSVLS